MDVGRLGLGSAAEWTIAGLFLFATVGVGLLIMHEMRALDRPPTAGAAPGTVPAVVPAGLPALSIPVPSLRLPGAGELRRGDTLEKVSRMLGREAETGVQVVEEARTGTRLTRGYEYGRIRFTIVFEPFERNGEFRIAGIYVQ